MSQHNQTQLQIMCLVLLMAVVSVVTVRGQRLARLVVLPGLASLVLTAWARPQRQPQQRAAQDRLRQAQRSLRRSLRQ